jgi:hypothetical protein
MREIFIKLPNKFIEKPQGFDFNRVFINIRRALINVFRAKKREK